MPGRTALLVAAGVVAVSFAAIFIRYAEANALVIAFYRQAMAAAVVLPVVVLRRRHELRRMTLSQATMAVGSGALLAVHFATWIPSVKLTTVAASVVLVTSSPLFVALASQALFGERVGHVAIGGIVAGLAGAAIISGGDFALSSRAVAGDLLALAGALAAGGYFLAGRRLRQDVSLLTYIGVVYTSCAVLLWPVAVASGGPLTGFDPTTWAMFVLLALVPQVFGHTAFNYALKDVSATVVSISIMGEPIGSTVLAMAFFGETPPWTALLGGALILAGIYVAVTSQARPRRAEREAAPAVTPLE
ncbi:MAG: DMT family transporter [Actinomycetota bacterium]